MSRPREFEQFLSRRKQGREDKATMLFHIMGGVEVSQRTAVEAAVISPAESKFRPYSGAIRLLLAIGVAGALNLADRFNSAYAKDPIPTVVATTTPTAVATRTATKIAVGTAQAGLDSRVVVSEDGRSITIENINTNNNTANQDLFNRIIDFLRNPSQAPVSAAASKPSVAPLPIPHPTPTLTYQEQTIKDLENEIQGLRLKRDKVEVQKDIERLEQQLEALRNPSPTPDRTKLAAEATIVREALATAGRETVAARIADATASVPAAIRTADAKVKKAGIKLEAAQLESEARELEKEAERLKTPSPSSSPSSEGGQRENGANGGFPWLPLILVTGGLGAIYLWRRRIIPPPVVGAPRTLLIRIRNLGGPGFGP